jgi:hypothetical protein
MPATSGVATPWATQLAGKYFRTALVKIHIPGRVVCGIIKHDGTRVVTPGAPTTFAFGITDAYTDTYRGYWFNMISDAHGVAAIPLHYIAAGTDGDLSECLVILTGFLHADTGA